jgi:hypothetical protein
MTRRGEECLSHIGEDSGAPKYWGKEGCPEKGNYLYKTEGTDIHK